MKRFHLRRAEKEISSIEEIFEILSSQRYMTVACCKGDTPYLFTVNYAFDKSNLVLYFHCASIGKKLEFISFNPRVWGEVIEDRGYLPGKCDYNFRSVHFEGESEIVSGEKEKYFALKLLVEQQEPEPENILKNLSFEQIQRTAIVKIKILGISGKKYPG